MLAFRSGERATQRAAHRWTASGFVSLLQLIGGFKVTAIEEIEVDGQVEGFMLVANCEDVALVGGPLGFIGPEMAAACQQNPAVLGELHFYLGTILIQAGDAESAAPHYRRVLEREPDSNEARFGLGMCLGRLGDWKGALEAFEACRTTQPEDANIETWVELARDRIAAAADPAPTDAATLTPQAAVTPVRPVPAAVPQDEASRAGADSQRGLRAARGAALRIGDRG